MSRVLIPTLQRLSGHRLQKIRELSLAGTITVKPGDTVKVNDVVAKAEFPGDLMILRIPEQLGIEAEDVVNSMLINENEQVETGQKLCEYKGLFGIFKNTYLSPYSGKIEFINKETGHLGLRLPSRAIELDAYISGKVISIEEKKSVTIETICTFIQGIFGVGGEKHGVLKALQVKPDAIVFDSDIPPNCTGKILFGGASADIKALKKASAGGAAGFITGSIDDKALAEFLGYDIGIALTGNEDISMTIIVTEGFGKLSFSDSALKLLTACDGKEASINGATQVRAGALRPEIIISGGEVIERNLAEQNLDIGTEIRIIREPYFGLHAKIKEMPFKPEVIETGAEVRVLRAVLTDGKVVSVPRANVEIL